MITTQEKELTQPQSLCLPNGKLNPQAMGWSRHPLLTCNLSGHPLRKKRWNYWCITSPRNLFSITLSDVDYMGLAFAYALDFDTKVYSEQTVSTILGNGFDMNPHVSGKLSFVNPRMTVEMDDQGEVILIKTESPDFDGKKLSAEFKILRPKRHETLNVVIPWNENRFQFTSKQECLPASGKVTIGGETILFNDGESFACLDFGRGVWKYDCSWNWAAFSGRSGDHIVGVNLGAKWTDGTGYTENGVVVDGKVIKIGEDLLFDYDPAHFMNPWHISAPKTGLVNLSFTPFFERVAKSEALFLRSEAHQMIGRFEGEISDADGTIYPIHDLVGWAEEHHAHW
jgi:hypothetical protein